MQDSRARQDYVTEYRDVQEALDRYEGAWVEVILDAVCFETWWALAVNTTVTRILCHVISVLFVRGNASFFQTIKSHETSGEKVMEVK